MLSLSLVSFLSHFVSYSSLPSPTLQPYEPQLFGLCVQCLAAVAKALPPDHIDPDCVSQTERKTSMDTDGHFDPQPVDTAK